MSQRAKAATFYDLGQVPVVRKVDNVITHSINHYPVDTVSCFVNTYPLDIPLTNRVRGPYCKLRTEFFPFDYGPSAKCAGHKSTGKKTRIRNLQYGLRKRGQ